ncbi:hypothetical protein M0813_27197 [Anaeramoeba flamelloides]|uniref:Uncharacterized protein n=1 Tax=Anaeramoeba flamelloides TaxID=1746091 RepID=A0AAV8A3R4_9EUKA|nr:hypothetical protein M0812_07423 [Anaeramoeba flamelloides]KAJ6237634.1 hypothetical protein M0813_27197 [Anaeramoeba flamelloides]
MRLTNFSVLIFLIIGVAYCCDNHKGCKNEDEPWCVDSKCVECQNHTDCDLDKYCTEKNACKKYSDDNKFGEYCDSERCIDIETMKVCGKCVDNETTTWRGACIDFKCEMCDLNEDWPNEYDLVNQHAGLSKCYPKGSNGAAGVVGKYQKATNTPNGLVQNGISIGFFIIGFLFFGVLITQCIIMKKLTS